MPVATSVNGVPIRLTDERWAHIVDRHRALMGRQAEVLDAMEHPDEVLPAKKASFWHCGKLIVYIW